MFKIRLVVFLMLMYIPLLAHANSYSTNDLNGNKLVEYLINKPTSLISEYVQEKNIFYGLASYYNNVDYFIVDEDSLRQLYEGEDFQINRLQWLAVVGRFRVLLVKANGLSLKLDMGKLVINNPQILNLSNTIVSVVTKAELPLVSPELGQVRYNHLWGALAWIAEAVELSLVTINKYFTSNWGLTIIIFSLLLKLILMPVSFMTVNFQRKVSQVQAILAPRLVEIKAIHDGEEAHNLLMAAHKRLGVTPFYTLKPMLGSFIQIPIMISVFNVLGEMSQLDGQSFLWIDNLAYPDAFDYVLFNIPMFGNTISFLPFLMAMVAIYSTVIFQNRHAPKEEVQRQKRNLYLMSIAFFILFYPFPAAMIFYWTFANIIHTFQQQIIRI